MKHSSAGAPLLAAAALLLLLLQLFASSEAAIECSDVIKDLAPCTSYLTGSSGSPSDACCTGVSTLASAASTSADRRAACSCIQSAAQQIKPSEEAAEALPGKCGITLPYAISLNVDCSQIS